MEQIMTTFHPYHLTQTDVADDADRAFLSQQIKQFNNVHSPHHLHVRTHPPRPLDLLLRNDAGEIVAGLAANTYWSWLDIEDLWVHEALRGQGFGQQLLALAEAEAQMRNCRYAMLTTFSFQARAFYEKWGYTVVGALADYPPGETYYWLRKVLVNPDRNREPSG
ncbi:MAG: GNAT family N-acetyltransferase, partial [Caldilineaceae bacterium]|nr:GNAT family N-acetyltransferase [Caldilineaceae bacterium]